MALQDGLNSGSGYGLLLRPETGRQGDAGLLDAFAGIDLEQSALATGLSVLDWTQEAAIGGSTDQRVVAAFQLFIEGRDHLAPGLGFFGSHRLVAADDMAPARDHELLDEARSLLAARTLEAERIEAALSNAQEGLKAVIRRVTGSIGRFC